MKKIRFGILGTGFMGRTHAEAIRRLDKIASLSAVWGGSRAPALAKDYGAALETSMESLVKRDDVDAIIIAPVVVTGWDKVLEEAKTAGIPVFLADRDVDVKDKSLFVTRISADFNLEGKLAGAWLAQASKGNCDVVELQGTTGAAPAKVQLLP